MARNSGTGQGGKSFQDRLLAADVRSLGLQEINYILIANGFSPAAQKARERMTIPPEAKNKDLYETIVAKLAGTVLPRLNEHSGVGGEPMQISFDNSFDATPRKTKRGSKK